MTWRTQQQERVTWEVVSFTFRITCDSSVDLLIKDAQLNTSTHLSTKLILLLLPLRFWNSRGRSNRERNLKSTVDSDRSSPRQIKVSNKRMKHSRKVIQIVNLAIYIINAFYRQRVRLIAVQVHKIASNMRFHMRKRDSGELQKSLSTLMMIALKRIQVWGVFLNYCNYTCRYTVLLQLIRLCAVSVSLNIRGLGRSNLSS